MRLRMLAAFYLVATAMLLPALARAESSCAPLPQLAPQPLADDLEQEAAYCAIDFDSDSIALCPKTWSTSPAALVYALSGTPWEGRAAAFEQQLCGPGGSARDEASRELAFFKNTLNGRKTSGTFAPASLLYYHFSRLLQTRLQVPVAVPVSFPASTYRERVVAPGQKFSDGKHSAMLHEGWLELDRAMADPEQYAHERELFIDDGSRLWGVLLMPRGKRYGPEVNGTRASGWGEGQNRDFQRTAPFIALRTDAPLAEAIAIAVRESRGDPAIASALSADISPVQVAWWMHEITELVLLDYILGQQDRIGNVDYQVRWIAHDQGKIIASEAPSVEGAQKLRVTVLNDNDAGVRSGYANYARTTGMLEGWHHMDAGLYQRVQALAADFRQSGPVAKAVASRYRLSSREASRILERGAEAAGILRERCESGALRFDLALGDVLAPESAGQQEVTCGP